MFTFAGRGSTSKQIKIVSNLWGKKEEIGYEDDFHSGDLERRLL